MSPAKSKLRKICIIVEGVSALFLISGFLAITIATFVLSASLWLLLAVEAKMPLDGRPLIGPLVWFELTRSARRGRDAWLRGVYALLLLGVLFLVYSSWVAVRGQTINQLFEDIMLPPNALARFSGSFYMAFMSLQFLTVLTLTPAFTAGAIAQEKERHTLEYLLTTDLTDREIILGKLFARLGHLALLLLTGLPIFALMQLVGGVDPNLVFCGFLITIMTMATIGSLCILISVLSRTFMEAGFMSYFVTGTLSLVLFPIQYAAVASAVHQIDPTLNSGGLVTGALFYAAFNGCMSLVLSVMAVSELRGERAMRRWAPPPRVVTESVELVEAVRPIEIEPAIPSNRPPICDQPAMWKELYYEQGIGTAHWSDLTRNGTIALIVISICVVFFCVPIFAVSPESRQAGNVILRVACVIASTVASMVVAARAAVNISRERERQTLDCLFTTSLGRDEILQAKWLGCFFSVHAVWWLLIIMWGLGTLSLCLNLLALPLVIGGTVAFAGFMVSLGLYFSTLFVSVRATMLTLTVALMVEVLPALLAYYTSDLMQILLPNQAKAIETFLTFGLTPPVALYTLAFGYGNAAMASEPQLVAAIFGVVCYALAAWWLWRRTLARIERQN
jgi:ABC-type transport system involved in multi-copper enzyme maturation permease subunit